MPPPAPSQNSPAPAAISPQAGGLPALVLAALLGLAGVVFIAFTMHWVGIAPFQNSYSPQTQLNITALAPIVFVMVLILVLAVNPLLKRFFPWLALGRRELLIVLAMWLIGAVAGSENLLHPALHNAGNAQNRALQKATTKRMEFDKLLNPAIHLAPEAAEIYDAGLSSDTMTHSSFLAVPWGVWRPVLLFWLPFLFVAALFASSLVQIVHRQWSKHELLTYPIAGFADSLLEHRPDRRLPEVFYDKVFWIGFGLISFIFMVNGLRAWFPLMIEIPLNFMELDIMREFPFLSKYCGREAYSFFRGWIYVSVVALAVLLPIEISFTCWAGWILMVIIPGFYFLFSGHNITGSETSSLQLGMYIAMLGAILVIGRKEYWSILRHAVTFRRAEDPALRSAVHACRLFVLAFAALVGLLTWVGLYWFVAVVLAMVFALIVILIARMTAEIGIPWLVSFSGATNNIPLKLLGSVALGPKGLAFMSVVGIILTANTADSIAAAETTCRKLEEKQSRLPRWAFNLFLLAALCVALVAGTCAAFWDNYSFGSRREGHLRQGVVSAMENASSEISRLRSEGKDADLSALPPGERFSKTLSAVRPDANFWSFFLAGAVIIAGCSFMRLRFTWWPFHPLPLLLIDTWCLSRLFASFFIAWVIKVALLRIGGGKFFTQAKPFFIGVIIGQLTTIVFWILVGIVYYLVKGVPPEAPPPLI
jgi:hypothetical protein